MRLLCVQKLRSRSYGKNLSQVKGLFVYTRSFYDLIRMLFFPPRLNILIFLSILGWKYSCIILKLKLRTDTVSKFYMYRSWNWYWHWTFRSSTCWFFSFCWLEGIILSVKLKTYVWLLPTGFSTHKIISFSKSQPQYSYKFISYRKKKSVPEHARALSQFLARAKGSKFSYRNTR